MSIRTASILACGALVAAVVLARGAVSDGRAEPGAIEVSGVEQVAKKTHPRPDEELAAVSARRTLSRTPVEDAASRGDGAASERATTRSFDHGDRLDDDSAVDRDVGTAPPEPPLAPLAHRAARAARRRAAGLPRLRADDAAASGLDWLVLHQEKDGRWDADGFDQDAPTTARGAAGADLRVTSLAVLALAEDGHSMLSGQHKDTVKRATRWIAHQRDRDTGRIGERSGLAGVLDHALSTLALVEVNASDRSVLLAKMHGKALTYLDDMGVVHAPHVGSMQGLNEEVVLERWIETSGRMRAYSSAASRQALRLEGDNTLVWRWRIHTTFAGSDDAQDVFAGYTHDVLADSSNARIESTSNELFRAQNEDGSFGSSDPRHADLGRVGTTALHVVALAILADRLDETHDSERWNR